MYFQKPLVFKLTAFFMGLTVKKINTKGLKFTPYAQLTADKN
jgi:hypothetical protein